MTIANTGVEPSIDELIQYRLSARSITLSPGRRVTSATAGVHESRFRGRGVDYQESRIYQAGDDIRNMDWRVTARTGRAHTKLYQEERERPVILMLDLNPSMYFGTRVCFKSTLAIKTAALLGWATIRSGDRIGAFVFGHGKHHEMRPSGGRRGVLRLIKNLIQWSKPQADHSDRQAEQLGSALQRLRRVARPGSLVFILSDFYHLGDETERHLSRLRQHNDIIACQIQDPLELEPPPPGRYSVTDGLAISQMDLRSGKKRTQYQDYFNLHQTQLDDMLSSRKVPKLSMRTDRDVVSSLRLGLRFSGKTP